MKLSAHSQQSLSITYVLIFLTGLACMAVAGYFLIEGLSQFSGSAAARRMLIIGGILFQLTESICFISASALTYHSLRWRYILFTLGIVLFGFSIAVMTLAQKTALQTGEAQANAIDEKRQHIRQQIQSLEQVIASYRFNAERQSKSIYKDSRALGQDSINRAAELEEKKYQLSEQLFQLNSQRRQTSSDFFTRLEEVTGLPQKTTEFYFLVIRSLLLELCAIILMSFGANLRAYNKLVADAKKANVPTAASPRAKETTAMQTSISSTAGDNKVNAKQVKPLSASQTKKGPASGKNKSTKVQQVESSTRIDDDNNYLLASPSLRQEHIKQQTGASAHQLELLFIMAMDIFEQKLIQDLDANTIQSGLNQHCGRKINQEQATMLSKMMNSRMEESC